MPSPIFFPQFIKKYMVQTRRSQGAWSDREAHKKLEEAERAVRALKRQNSEIEIRIFNRVTGRVVK